MDISIECVEMLNYGYRADFIYQTLSIKLEVDETRKNEICEQFNNITNIFRIMNQDISIIIDGNEKFMVRNDSGTLEKLLFRLTCNVIKSDLSKRTLTPEEYKNYNSKIKENYEINKKNKNQENTEEFKEELIEKNWMEMISQSYNESIRTKEINNMEKPNPKFEIDFNISNETENIPLLNTEKILNSETTQYCCYCCIIF